MRFRTAGHLFLSAWLAFAVTGCSSYQRDQKRAAALEAAGKYAEALDIRERVVAKVPASDVRTLSVAYAELGECLIKLQQYPEALSAFNKALALDETNRDARENLAELMLLGGAAEQAMPHLDRLLNEQPNNAGALAVRGSAYALLNQSKMAEADYRRSIALDAQHPE